MEESDYNLNLTIPDKNESGPLLTGLEDGSSFIFRHRDENVDGITHYSQEGYESRDQVWWAIMKCESFSDLVVVKSPSGRTDPEVVMGELLQRRGILRHLKKSRSFKAIRIKNKLKSMGYFI